VGDAPARRRRHGVVAAPACAERAMSRGAIDVAPARPADRTAAASPCTARVTAWAVRIPAAAWLALCVAALAPVWVWIAARFADGSDEPLGLVALAALLVLVVRDRHGYAGPPRPAGLALSLALVAVVTAGGASLAPLARAVLAVAATFAMLAALRRRGQPLVALAVLGLLALPLISSLQFFAGFPLRVVTAEATRVLLALGGAAAERSGTALVVAGRLVMVDAPCAGIHMGWIAYFTACFAAAWLHVRDACLLRRLPLVGLLVLTGNVLRNAVLVTKEAGLVAWPGWTHEAVGLAVSAAVCAAVLRLVAGVAAPAHAPRSPAAPDAPRAAARLPTQEPARISGHTKLPWPAVRPAGRTGSLGAESGQPDSAKSRSSPPGRGAGGEGRDATTNSVVASLAALGAFALLAVLAWAYPAATGPQTPDRTHVEWPAAMDGRALRPLALSAVEERFSARFAGSIARFTDGERIVVLRHVVAPTRMLHPAADCYRGAGYRIDANGLERRDSPQGPSLQRCFVAARGQERLRVCEWIVDATGTTYTDTSSWYWASALGRSPGPWQAVTIASRL